MSFQSTSLGRQNQLPSPASDSQGKEILKRKRRQDTEEQFLCRASNKRARLPSTTTASDRPETLRAEGDCDPVTHWARYNTWPANFAEDYLSMSEPKPKKRSHSTSYTQSVKDGKNPKAYSPAYEKEIVKYGMIMDAYQDQATITDECKKLCADLLEGAYEAPVESLFEENHFWTVLRGVQNRNEARVARDITPLIVPSAELLHIRRAADLEHIADEVNADWFKCNTLCGPCPRPDYAAGLASSAFTPDEIQKLKTIHTGECPTYVTGFMYFPFLMCEVKCGEEAINQADRQNMHSASIAVNAIVQLYRKVSLVHELNRKILVFSISHDPRMVRIYGHYALITEEKTKFYRHLIHFSDFTVFNGRDRWTAYNFTRKVYDSFVPAHLERIRSALSQLDERPSESAYEIILDGEADGADSQGLVTIVPSSQDVGVFKKPSLPSTSMLQRENDKLQDQVSMLLRQQQEQERKQQENISKLQDMLVEQKEQQMEQKEQQKEQMEQQKEQMEQQKEQMEQQKGQMGQYKEMIDMLKQQMSTKG